MGIDRTYEQALHEMRVSRYGNEVTKLMEDYADRTRREARIAQVAVTPEEMKAGDRMVRAIESDIRSTYNGDLPPSVAEWYREGREAQQKQDSTFLVPGTSCGVQLNPDDSLTFVGCSNISSDMACQLASIIYTLDALLDLTVPDPYAGYGQNAAAYAEMQRKQGVGERVRSQFLRLRPR